MFELWPLETRLFPTCRTFFEGVKPFRTLSYHTIPRANISIRSRISQLLQKKVIQPRICVVKMEIDQRKKTLFIASFCVVKMQISWYESDRSCGNKGTESGEGSKLAYAPRTAPCTSRISDTLLRGLRVVEAAVER